MMFLYKKFDKHEVLHDLKVVVSCAFCPKTEQDALLWRPKSGVFVLALINIFISISSR